MDPSEEIEFERKMMSDENLLIEVESLRSTYNKVKQLPIKQVPKEIIDRVKKQAVLEQQKSLKWSFNLVNWFGKGVAAAATILLLISIGLYTFSSDSDPLIMQDLDQNIMSTGVVQPWVDRNEVINISDRIDVIKAQNIGEDFEKSFDKLIPISTSVNQAKQRQSVLLTSSKVNQ
jgi:hypothetical protein